MRRSYRIVRIAATGLVSAWVGVSALSCADDSESALSTHTDSAAPTDELDAMKQDGAGTDDTAGDARLDSLSDANDASVDALIDAPSTDVSVVVTNIGVSRPDVEVVFHDADGAILGIAKTNAEGKATWSGASPTMVTALLGNDEFRQLLTWVGVKPGDVLNVDDLITDWKLGRYTLTTKGTLSDAGANYFGLNVNGCQGGSVSIPMGHVTVNPGCTRPQNTFTISAASGSKFVGHAYAKNIPPMTDGGAVSVQMSDWLAPTPGHVSVVNATLPPGEVAQPLLFEIANGNGLLRGGESDSALGTATFSLIPGFADALQGGFDISTNNGAARRAVEKRVPSGDITVDFANALPEILNVQLDVTELMRPAVKWSSVTSLAVADGGMIRLPFSGGWGQQWRAWNFIVPPHATSVKAPILPDSAAPWLPPAPEASATEFDPPRVFFLESDTLAGYDDVRQRGAVLVPPSSRVAPEARVVLPTDGNLRFTSFQAFTSYAH
jgi:hypothetical protein